MPEESNLQIYNRRKPSSAPLLRYTFHESHFSTQTRPSSSPRRPIEDITESKKKKKKNTRQNDTALQLRPLHSVKWKSGINYVKLALIANYPARCWECVRESHSGEMPF